MGLVELLLLIVLAAVVLAVVRVLLGDKAMWVALGLIVVVALIALLGGADLDVRG